MDLVASADDLADWISERAQLAHTTSSFEAFLCCALRSAACLSILSRMSRADCCCVAGCCCPSSSMMRMYVVIGYCCDLSVKEQSFRIGDDVDLFGEVGHKVHNNDSFPGGESFTQT